jgi:hypothetical protein
MTAIASRPASFEGYLHRYGKTLGRKAVKSLDPLYVADRDGYPDFSEIEKFNPDRIPFEPQGHVIAAAAEMLRHAINGFLIGEMGTGKTIMGMLAVHKHAAGQPYRAMILCPDHLISKWEQEVRETIPGAVIHRFENWKGMMGLFDSGVENVTIDNAEPASVPHEETVAVDGGPRIEGDTLVDHPYEVDHIESARSSRSGKLVRRRKRWTKPVGPTWYILGRNQSKFLPEKMGIGQPHSGYHLINKGEGSAQVYANRSVHSKLVGHAPQVDDQGKPIIGQDGKQLRTPIIDRRVMCPSCGMSALGQKSIPLTVNNIQDKKPYCKGHFLKGIPQPIEGKDGKSRIPDGTDRLPGSLEYAKQIGKVVKVEGHSYKVVACREPLWNFTKKPYRYAPANIIQRKLRGLFKYLVIDEVHEQKSDESAQSMAAGKLMGVSKHVLALTGTLIGGYAHHLFPLLLRMSPGSIRKEGFRWACDLDWSQAYGRVDRIVTTKQEAGEVTHARGQSSMRKARTGKAKEDFKVRPGVMPTLYGRHMLGNTIFLMLEELADELPDMNEYVGGPLMEQDPHRAQFTDESDEDYRDYIAFEDARHAEYEEGYFDTAVQMDAEMEDAYQEMENDLVTANRELLASGCMKLMGTMLWTTMDYPDMPYGWRGEHPGLETVGYYVKPHDKTTDNYVGVTSPTNLDESVVRPKEQRLIDICKQQKKEGRQSWVYVNMTGKRNVQPRLARLLREAGLKVAILKSSEVDPIDRKDWIDENGPKYDVIISNPLLVSTGLDLFSKKEGGHNFSTLIFYETGYNLFTLRQAARRAWRIGQPLNCRVYYLYYCGTMQHRAMQVISKKMAGSAALEGEFSAEGLAGMTEDDSAAMALAKSLKDSIDDADTARGWTKLKSRSKATKPKVAAAKSSVLELLGLGDDEAEQGADALRLVGQTMIDHGVPQEELDRDVIQMTPTSIEETTVDAAVAKRTRKRAKANPVVIPADDREVYRLPAISREQLAAMFRNLEENGMTLEDFDS